MTIRFGPGPPAPPRARHAHHLDALTHALTTALSCWALIGAML